MRRLLRIAKSPQAGLILMALLVAAVVVWRGPIQASAAAGDDLNPMETRVLGYSEWLTGSTASLRVITTRHDTGEPLRSWVVIRLAPKEQEGESQVLFRGRTDKRGTLSASFPVPDALEPGSYELTVQAGSPLKVDYVKQPVSLVDAVQILLTTDKPIYQPGQVMHLRALALHKPSLKPVSDEKLTLEVEDAKGNKLFKKAMPASKFGIASADFQLAREINLGVWTVRAVLPQGQTEKKVTVDRYVLPKFKVTVKTDEPFYLPGQTATGSVQADYFFGKPVSGGEVRIDVSTFDIGWTQIAEVMGKTDQNGTYKFEVDLPDSFVGQPLEQGKALVKLEASVVDRADHKEKATISVPVAKDPLVITVVPESGKLRKGLENTIYIMVTTPDGTPAAARIGVAATETFEAVPAFPRDIPLALTTDRLGIAEWRFTPQGDKAGLRVLAQDQQGNTASRTVTLDSEIATDAIILRADKALAAVGDSVTLTAICTRERGTVYLDAIKDRQTVLTRAVDLKDGRATLRMPITPDLVGTVEFHAYKILPSEDIIRDSRTVYVSPAKDLRIVVDADKEVYRPGGKANLTFTVTDQDKHPILAALGIAVVDESVFALQEMQPGLEKIYFTLEKELMEPRYEIHGLRPAGVVKGDLPLPPDTRVPTAERADLRQEAAKVLFASAPRHVDFTIAANTYVDRLQEKMQEWAKQMGEDAQAINRALRSYYNRHREWLDPKADIDVLVDERFLARGNLRDPWGRPYRVHWRQNWCTLDSAGPDGNWDTNDDMRGIGEWARRGGRVALDERGRLRAVDAVFEAAAEGEVGGLVFFGRDDMRMEGMAVPAAAMKAGAAAPHAAPGPAAEPVRVRQFFPETMFVNPALITDERGRARLSIDMADSITTWRLTALGSSLDGLLGSTTKGLRCFQDFFVDIDLPVSLTQNDEVSIPIAIYNYLPTQQTVRLKLEQADWFELMDEPEKSVEMAKNDVGVIYFRFKVKQIGTHKMTVHAYGSEMSDAIRREIEVLPDGKEIRDTWNDRLEKDVERTVTIPKEAIAGASTILVKVYPGFFSQAIEGLDSMLRMPFGCFEQTSSVTYPNVLVMDYLKTTKQIKPELQMKAEQYINVGYQRLVSYEVKGGGFSWFGNAPAHKILTAYGLLEFNDMAKVHEVDPRLIERTQRWLAGQQQDDGTWEPDKGGIAEGIINRQQGVLRVTAYIAWALAETGYKGPELDKALAYVRKHWAEETDPYGVAVVANAFLSVSKDDPDGLKAVDRLAEMAVEKDKVAYWQSKTPTFTSAKADSADLETTGLAAYALVKSGRHLALVNKVLTYLIQSKDSFGTWHTTQATVWSLKTLLLTLERATSEVNAAVTVSINGRKAGSFEITPENSDVMRQVDLREFVKPGANDVKIAFAGKGSALYQVVSKYYLPWSLIKPPGEEVLDIGVAYDKTRLAKDDTATCTVTVRNNTDRTAEMVIVDLGLPPGFAVETANLDKYVEDKTIQKYTLAARQIIVYVEEIAPRKTLTLKYGLRAKFPIKAKTPKSRTYLYYNPEVESTAQPIEMTVAAL